MLLTCSCAVFLVAAAVGLPATARAKGTQDEARRAEADAESAYLAAEGARGVDSPVSVADLRSKVLETDQVMLEYRVGQDSSLVVLVSQDRCRAARIAAGADSLHALVGAMIAGIRTGDPQPPAAHALYDLLLAPLAAEIPPEARLVFVPDGALSALPFAALHDGRRYLVETHPLSSTPTATALRGAPLGTIQKLAPGDDFIPVPPDTLAREVDAKNLPPDVVLQRWEKAAIAKGEPPRQWAGYVAAGRMHAPRRRQEGEFPLWLVPIGMGAGVLMIFVAMRLVPRATQG